MAGTEAFPDLGSHCSEEYCHQLDFLPFQCDTCSKIFCLQHRSYTAHHCPKAGIKDSSVLICPVCAATVRKVFDENPDITIEKHMQIDCDPSNYERVMNKPKCPVRRCREILTTTNNYVCKSCKLKVCLKHRFPTDHACMRGLKTRTNVNDLTQDFMKILGDRNGTDCATSSSKLGSRIGSATSKSMSAH